MMLQLYSANVTEQLWISRKLSNMTGGRQTIAPRLQLGSKWPKWDL